MTKKLQNTIIINDLIEKLQEIKKERIDSVDIVINSRYEDFAKMVDGTIYMKNFLDISITDNELIERKETRI